MLEGDVEKSLLLKIEDFKKRRGLLPPNRTPVEVKWQKVEDERKEAKKRGKPNRYEEYLDIFFDEVKAKRLSFGYMFLDKRDYDEIEGGFLDIQSDNKQNYFFMLYFQFLYHCFIKSQVKQVPCEIWIDNLDMAGCPRKKPDVRTLAEAKLTREDILENHKSGDTLVGHVVKILDNGAMINIYGFETFIHQSELSWDEIQHPSEVLDVGQPLLIQFTLIDPLTNRIKISARFTQPKPKPLD